MPEAFDIADPSPIEYSFACIRATQPIGDIFIASIPFRTLIRISYFDVRRVLQADRDVERYLGIQRPIDDDRVKSLSDYVTYKDASFPTSVILAVDEEFAKFNHEANTMTVSNFRAGETTPSIAIGKLARVLDGQHRIAGLRAFAGETFDVPVTIFVGADIADQAQIFATVNLEQTKVHKSLVYDLFSLARTPSPQKTCHNIAVALDRDKNSALFQRIKRLGFATEGRVFEPITQATFVESLMPYLSADPKKDRDVLLRGDVLEKTYGDDLYKMPFRNLFVEKQDMAITDAVDETQVKVFTNYRYMLWSAGVLKNEQLQPNNLRQRWLIDAVLLFWDREIFDGSLSATASLRALEDNLLDKEVFKLLRCSKQQCQIFARAAFAEFAGPDRARQLQKLRDDGAVAA